MKNQIEEIKKLNSKEEINLRNAKINLSNSKKELTTKEGRNVHSKKSIYKNLENLNSEEQKRFRQKIRTNLHRFVNSILGKDRSESERIEAIQKFLIFYSENWKIQDFKFESFSLSKNSADIKDYSNLLEYVKSTLE